ncbi:class I SAM-dependent methyltransferase [Actinoplanes missouriensis]|nr:class I SAM-dependent methyltransferase [Actinoplanes missouriensis]
MFTQVELSEELCGYVRDVSLRDSPLLSELRDETRSLPVASMQVSAEQGQFLSTLVRAVGARRTLEVGVFTGYSLVSTALALPPDGTIVACDVSAEWTQVAMRYCERAGVAGKVDLRLGPAADTLRGLRAEGRDGTFDFAFIDADKESYEQYYELALALVRPGGTLVFDNVLWSGLVVDDSTTDPETVALRDFNARRRSDERIDLSVLPYADGLTVAVKR